MAPASMRPGQTSMLSTPREPTGPGRRRLDLQNRWLLPVHDKEPAVVEIPEPESSLLVLLHRIRLAGQLDENLRRLQDIAVVLQDVVASSKPLRRKQVGARIARQVSNLGPC